MAEKPRERAEGDYADKFRDILNNRAKFYSQEDKESLRKNGFVVLVRGGKDLEPIQTLCSEQTYNRCLTVHYRLPPGTFLGTLFAAFITDLKRLEDLTPDFLGDFDPNASDPAWKELLGIPLLESLIESFPDEKSGAFEEYIDELFKSLHRLPTGMRLVLFGEVGEGSHSQQELDQVRDIFSRLPERFGLVLSGLPEDFQLTTDDPRFLEFNLPEEPIESETYYKYSISPFHSDKPATKDYLGVYIYAEALARFVLHSQTVPPLTIGIHGPWGKGKSSFMEFVDIALVNWVKANREVKKKKLAKKDELVNLDNEIEQKKIESEKAINKEKKSLNAELKKIESEKAIDQEKKSLKAELKKKESEKAIDQEKKSLKAELKKKEPKREQFWKKMQDKAKKEVLTVHFNAWQYEDSKQIWAGLASKISENIEGALPRWLSIPPGLRYAWAKYKSKLLVNLFVAFLIALPGICYGICYLKDPQSISTFLGISDLGFGLLIPAGSVLGAISYFIRYSSKLVQPVSKRVLNYIQLPDYREQMGYQHKVMDDLIFVYKRLQHHTPGCKVVVFIDDLDRCSEEKIMEILQAINLILGNSKFFVFLGVETDMIRRAICSHYNNNHKDALDMNFSESYLRKIIQLSFYIPKTPDENRLEFLNTLFSTAIQGELNKSGKTQKKEEMKSEMEDHIGLPYDLDLPKKGETAPKNGAEVEDTAVELKTFHAYQTFIGDNPRETKKLVNIHRLIKIILQLKHSGVSWSVGWQCSLVKWLIFCTNWSDQLDIEMLAEKAKNSGKISLEELINDITKDNPPSRLREFINHTMPTSDDDDFKLGEFELKNLELAARISLQMQPAVTHSPDTSRQFSRHSLQFMQEQRKNPHCCCF